MNRLSVWLSLLVVFLAYGTLVAIFGFPGMVALSIAFGRAAVSIAVLWIFIPYMSKLFDSIPPPGGDYLRMGVTLMWLSNTAFSFGNEYGRITDTDMSIFTNPVAGFFSLLVLCGGAFHLLAPTTEKPRTKYIAVGVGLIGATALVGVAPYFR